MEYFESHSIPINKKGYVDTQLNYDDNATNIKYLSKQRLESLDHMLINRQQEIEQAIRIKEDINNDIIKRLERILSKRFDLRKDEYIMLIDKYGLKKDNISRKNIIDMVYDLKMKFKYVNETKKKMEDKMSKISQQQFQEKNRNTNMMIEPPIASRKNDIMSILTENDNKDEQRNLEDELQKLIKERRDYGSGINMNNFEPPINNQTSTNNETSFVYEKKSMNNVIPKNIENPINYESSSVNNIENKDVSDHIVNNINDKDINKKFNIDIQSKENIGLLLQETIKDIIKENLNNHTDMIRNTNEMDKEKHIIEEQKIEETEDINLIINIIDFNNNELSAKIKYSENNSISNIKKIELMNCFINENFYENNFSDYPYLILKIKEFSDVLHINNSDIGGFSYLIFNKNGNFYNYNNDNTFGFFYPEKDFNLDTLTVEIYTPSGKKLDIFNIEENDNFNITLKIKRFKKTV